MTAALVTASRPPVVGVHDARWSTWTTPGGIYEHIPGQDLRPGHGLVTSTRMVEVSSEGAPDKVSVTRYDENGLDPVFGVSTSTTSGGSTRLTARVGYEAPGSGYLRYTSKTLPSELPPSTPTPVIARSGPIRVWPAVSRSLRGEW